MNSTYENLNDEQRTFLDYYKPPHVFAVITWGCAAGRWLAHALNSHPDIYCVHAANDFWSKLGGFPRVDGPEYLSIIGSQGHGYGAAGDVHGVSRHTVPRIKAAFGENFSCAVVVREPIRRLYSQLALFERFKRFRTWNVDYLDRMIEKQLLKLPNKTYDALLFVHGANMLNAVVEEQRIAPIYRSEDLTSNAVMLSIFIEFLTRGKVKVDAGWAAATVCRPKLNSHVVRSRSSASLCGWQMDVIRRVVVPQAWEIYTELGYPVPDFL